MINQAVAVAKSLVKIAPVVITNLNYK